MRNEAPLQECVEQFSQALPDYLGERSTAKKIARQFGSKVETTRKWTTAHNLPEWRVFTEMVATWGAPFLLRVFRPALQKFSQQSLRHRIQMLRGELADLDRELAELERRAPDVNTPTHYQLDLPLAGGDVCKNCKVFPLTEQMDAA